MERVLLRRTGMPFDWNDIPVRSMFASWPWGALAYGLKT
jgi:hypothetical protein